MHNVLLWGSSQLHFCTEGRPGAEPGGGGGVDWVSSHPPMGYNAAKKLVHFMENLRVHTLYS